MRLLREHEEADMGALTLVEESEFDGFVDTAIVNLMQAGVIPAESDADEPAISGIA